MKQEHQDVFIDLLIEKVQELERRVKEIEKATPSNGNTTEEYNHLCAEYEKICNLYEITKEENTRYRKEADSVRMELRKKILEAEKLTLDLKNAREVKVEDNGEIIKFRDAIRVRDEKITECFKKLEELRDIKEERDAVKEALSEARKKNQSLSGTNNVYKLMVDYAKASGFKFARAEKMKAFLDNDGIEDTEESKSESNVPSLKPEGIKDVEFAVGGHTPCPNNLHDRSGNKVEVGGTHCRKHCAFFVSADYDQGVVKCKI